MASADSAAREMASQISHYNDYVSVFKDGSLDFNYEKLTTLITQALKRCRNEALEEAADVAAKTFNDFMCMEHRHAICANATAAIRNLKEPE